MQCTLMTWRLRLISMNKEKHNPSDPAGNTEIDPVCGMTVSAQTAAGKYNFSGNTYYFCSAGCLARFKNDPESFLKRQEKAADLSDEVEYTCPMHPQIS